MIGQWGHADRDTLRDFDSLQLSAARRAALRIRGKLLGQGFEHRPIDDLESSAREMGFVVLRRQLRPDQGGAQAKLIPTGPNSFHVPVDPTPPSGWENPDHPLRQEIERHRLRFLVAHELAHSVFFEQPEESCGFAARRRPYSKKEEEFCDECARWILVPRTAVERMPACASSVDLIHKEFDVSVELSARAFASVHELPTTVLFQDDQENWIVQWDSSDGGRSGFVKPGSPETWAETSDSVSWLADRRQAILVSH